MKKRGRVKIHKIKTWQLLIVLVVLLFVDATLLRMDHVRMTELRDAVLTADASEDDAAVETALNELKDFVFNNIVINVVDDNGAQKVMFGTGPFYLEHTYIRAANRALEEAEKNMTADSNPNGNVYHCSPPAKRVPAIWKWLRAMSPALL